METWLKLYTGKLHWEEAITGNQVEAYGEKLNFARILPIYQAKNS